MVLEVYETGILEAIEDCLCGRLLGGGVSREEGGEVDELVLLVGVRDEFIR